jgi:hypothetical protein
MATHKTETRDEWLAARLALLEADKDYSRRGDELAQRRQELPSVAIEQPCTTGLIAPPKGATRRDRGGTATTSTPS